MTPSIKYARNSGSAEKIQTDCVVVLAYGSATLSPEARALDEASGKAISKILKRGDFDGKLESVLILHDLPGSRAGRVVVAGAGADTESRGGKGGKDGKSGKDGKLPPLDAKRITKVLRACLPKVLALGATKAHFAFDSLTLDDRAGDWLAERLAIECERAAYRYDHTKSKKASAPRLKSLSLALPDAVGKAAVDKALKQGQAIGAAINHARELGNLPGNVCTPTWLANRASDLAKKHDTLKAKVLTEAQMSKLGMHSLLSVSAGSAEEAKLIIIEYQGGKPNSKPQVIVGKGITFDTGGISLKPGLNMDEMKFDMCGAASVIATLGGVAQLQLPINVVGIVAAAENMPGSKATKPGDIVTSMSGQTIEILNTDAEGRLVLCDALTYAERYKPRTVIDIATLTGAAVATFGSEVNVLLGNHRELADTLLALGRRCLDPVWELPLWEEYQSMLDSNFADMANIGGPRAGTITAACFLSRFTRKFKWAHLDIAGSAWDSGTNKGATGRPVGLLLEYLRACQP